MAISLLGDKWSTLCKNCAEGYVAPSNDFIKPFNTTLGLYGTFSNTVRSELMLSVSTPSVNNRCTLVWTTECCYFKQTNMPPLN